MALRCGDKSRSVSRDGKQQMSLEEFKKWLMSFDSDKDGRISRGELRTAMRSCGAWFTTRKSCRGMKEADADGDGFIDEHEIASLMDFAEKTMGITFY